MSAHNYKKSIESYIIVHSNLTIYIFIPIIYVDSQTSRTVGLISKLNRN